MEHPSQGAAGKPVARYEDSVVCAVEFNVERERVVMLLIKIKSTRKTDQDYHCRVFMGQEGATLQMAGTVIVRPSEMAQIREWLKNTTVQTEEGARVGIELIDDGEER